MVADSVEGGKPDLTQIAQIGLAPGEGDAALLAAVSALVTQCAQLRGRVSVLEATLEASVIDSAALAESLHVSSDEAERARASLHICQTRLREVCSLFALAPGRFQKQCFLYSKRDNMLLGHFDPDDNLLIIEIRQISVDLTDVSAETETLYRACITSAVRKL